MKKKKKLAQPCKCTHLPPTPPLLPSQPDTIENPLYATDYLRRRAHTHGTVAEGAVPAVSRSPRALGNYCAAGSFHFEEELCRQW